jgi:hypothetical protein
MNQPKKRVLMGILAAGIITATISTLGMAKVFNFAAAQFQVPFQTQPRLQQQQPSAATTTATAASGGPNCNGCITTQNLANGAVTNPKLAAGAVSLTTLNTASNLVNVPPGRFAEAVASCPTGTVAIGGGFSMPFDAAANNLNVFLSGPASSGWKADAFNHGSLDEGFFALATCASIRP